MSQEDNCLDQERVVSYLYGECDAAERRMVEAHLAHCDACAGAVADLGGVRVALREWEPPDYSLGFRVMRELPVEPRRSRWTLPAWAQIAAAVLLVATGAAVANLDVRYGADGLVVRTGWSRASDDPVSRPTAGPPAAAPWRTDLAALEQRLRRELAASQVAAAPETVARPASDAQLLARVQQAVRDELRTSEQRQRQEFAVRLAQAIRDLDAQRRADLVSIYSGLGELQRGTGLEVARTNEMLRYLMRTSQMQVIK